MFVLLNTTDSLPMFDLAVQTFIQSVPYLISFAVLVFFFTYFLHKPVKEILKKRADRIEADIQNAIDNKTDAEELKTLYEQKLKDIELERSAILDEARKEATTRLDQILSEAKTEAQITRDRAKRDIAAEQERVKAEVHQVIIDISTAMAAKLVSATIDKQAHDRLFSEAMDELEAAMLRGA